MPTTHKGVIVLRRANQLIPDAYLDLVYKSFTTGQGIAFTVGDGMIDSFQSPVDPIVDFKKTMEEFKDTTIGYYFYEDTDGFRLEDVPPFSLIREEQEDLSSKSLLSVLLHGDYIGFSEEPVAHSNAYLFTLKYLQPKVLDLYNLVGKDMTKLMGALQQTSFGKDMLNQMYGDEGGLCFLSAEGEWLKYTKGDGYREYPWGWSTNHLGYQVTSAGQLPDAKAQKMAEARIRAAAARKAAAEEEQAEAPKPDGKIIASVEPIKQTEKVKDKAEEGTKFISPPAAVQSDYWLKQWYKDFEPRGKVPQNFKKLRPAVQVKLSQVEQALARTDGKPVIANQTADTPKTGYRAFTEALAEVKPVVEAANKAQEAPLTTHKPKTVHPESGSMLPLLDLEQQKMIHTEFLTRDNIRKHIGRGSEAIPDPKTVKDMMENVPSFHEQLGLKTEDTLNWSVESLLDLAEGVPMSLVSLTLTYQWEMLKAQSELRDLKTVKEHTEQPKPVTVPDVPAKRSFGSRGK